MGAILGKNEIVSAMKECEAEFDVPVTDRVQRAIKATFPYDCIRFVEAMFEETLGHKPQNQEWLNFLAWAVKTRNPWTPDAIIIASLRRLRVLAFTNDIVAIFKNSFDGVVYTMEVVARVAELHDYLTDNHLKHQDINQLIMTIAQQEQIPIFGVMLSMLAYSKQFGRDGKVELAHAVQSWLLYYDKPTQRYKQVELF